MTPAPAAIPWQDTAGAGGPTRGPRKCTTGAGRAPADTAPEEITRRHRFDTVKFGGDEDDGKGGNPSGGCGDGDGCGRT
jgi:hypothetical protein